MKLSAFDLRSNSAAPRALLAGFVCVYLIVGAITLTNGHAWGDDWAQYVLHAKNLISGREYAATGYLFNPDVPNVGPPSYPPGLSLLLSPLILLFGVNIVALKAACFVCILLALVFFFLGLEGIFGRFISLFSIVIFAAHPAVWQWRQLIQSEAPYLLFSAILLWYSGKDAERDVLSKYAFGSNLLIGVFLYFSVISRSIGITLLPALVIFGWAQGRKIRWFCSWIAVFVVLVWLQSRWLVKPTTYENELKLPTIDLIISNAKGYLYALGAELFPLPQGLSWISSTVIVTLTILGGRSLYLKQKKLKAEQSTLRSVVSCFPMILWYVFAYMSALILAAIEPNSRYLIPILPILISLALTGAVSLRRFISKNYSFILTMGVILYFCSLHFRSSPGEANATCTACTEMFNYVNAQSDRDAVIVFMKPRAMALLGNRKSWRPSEKYTREELLRHMNTLGATWVVAGADGSTFSDRYPMPRTLHDLSHESGSEVVFKNSEFEVIRLTQKP